MRNSKKGFTIIEMVIVIAIIGILASVLIPTYGNVVASANESAALQTCRSVMTNWLASSTSSSGVPTSGTDEHGNQFYAAYFEYNNNGTKYQYRYTSGGVERTDNNASYFVDFSKLAKIEGAYLTNPTEAGTSFNETTYAVNIYRQEKEYTKSGESTPTKYYVYYIEYPAGETTGGLKYAYDFGGATVYAATSEKQTIYTRTGTGAEAVYTAATIANSETSFVTPAANG